MTFKNIKKRTQQEPKFWSGYDERLETFKLGIMLKQARLESGLTQEQIAKSLKTTKSVVSRMYKHREEYHRGWKPLQRKTDPYAFCLFP